MGVVLLARAHPPAKNAGRVGQPREKSLIRKGWASPHSNCSEVTSVRADFVRRCCVRDLDSLTSCDQCFPALDT